MKDQNQLVIHLATDHAGFSYKNFVKEWLESEGYRVTDHGAHHLEEGDDFPDYIAKAAEAVSKDAAHARGVIFGGSGQGEAMLANRYKEVRAVVYYGGDKNIVTLSRNHNDTNVLSIGARFVERESLKSLITEWLEADFFTDGKYERRNQKIERLTRSDQ
jgi:ribose 5-phosphate isomerase B